MEMKVNGQIIDKAKLLKAQLDEHGREINNPIPAFLPAGPKPLTITEQIQRLLRVELSRQAAEQGYETFEENDDMELDDDEGDAPLSPYQDERVMKPDWPGPQERAELAKKADLADLDLELPDDNRKVEEPSPGGGSAETPPKKVQKGKPGK